MPIIETCIKGIFWKNIGTQGIYGRMGNRLEVERGWFLEAGHQHLSGHGTFNITTVGPLPPQAAETED